MVYKYVFMSYLAVRFSFKLYSKSLALVLLLLPFSCFTCWYHYCWILDSWPNWYPLMVPMETNVKA